jgi:hypothetical protein
MFAGYLTILIATMALVTITRPNWHNRPVEVFEIADCIFTEKGFCHFGLLAPFRRSKRPNLVNTFVEESPHPTGEGSAGVAVTFNDAV